MDKTCKMCPREAYAKGHCQYHYVKERDEGRLGAKPCEVPGCPRYSRAKNKCQRHYTQERKGVAFTEPAEREPGTWSNWYTMNTGYLARTRTVAPGKQETQLQHRHVMEVHEGRKLERFENVHHVNGDRTDNRIENLELWLIRQPPGQRVSDRIRDALWVLETYGGNPGLYEGHLK